MPFNFDADVLIHGQRVRTRPLPVLHPGKSIPRNVVPLLRSAGIMLQLSCTAKDDNAAAIFLRRYRRLRYIMYACFPLYTGCVIIGRELRSPYTARKGTRYMSRTVKLKMLPKRAKSRR
jgi:hypothetical protein